MKKCLKLQMSFFHPRVQIVRRVDSSVQFMTKGASPQILEAGFRSSLAFLQIHCVKNDCTGNVTSFPGLM